MKKIYLFTAALLLFCIGVKAQINDENSFKNPAVGFIENKGQIIDQGNNPNPDCLYLLNSKGMNIQLRKNGFSYDVFSYDEKSEIVNNHRIDIEFIDGNQATEIIPFAPSEDFINYFTTATPNEGISGVRYYQKVLYKNIYDKIDIEFVISNDQMKYNFIINPGGNINEIKLKYVGADNIFLNKSGNIDILTSQGKITESIPYSFEKESGSDVLVSYLKEGNTISFKASNFDKSRTLVIDPFPNRLWGTYFGGTSYDQAFEVETDASGNTFIAGDTGSNNNIATAGAHQTSYAGGVSDGYIAKFNGSNGIRLWATYFGGTSDDNVYGLAVDNTGNVVVTGRTMSNSGIASTGAHQISYGGAEDSFLTKFNGANGVRLWGTYYGGSAQEHGFDVAIDAFNNIYFCGMAASINGIATAGVYQTVSGGSFDGMVVKFDANGVHLWGTYYGGTSSDQIYGITIDGNNDVIFAGTTSSSGSIASVGAHQTSYGGSGDGFVVKLTNDGVTRVWGTYYGGASYDALGGTNNNGSGSIKTDVSNNIYVGGNTSSIASIASPGAYQTTYGGGTYDAMLVKFNSSGVRQWGTYFGGAGADVSHAITLDNSGDPIICGRSDSPSGIATVGAYQLTLQGADDGFFAKFNSTGAIGWSTYFGGLGTDWITAITTDPSDNIFVAGFTYSSSTIATVGTHQTSISGTNDSFLEKFDNPCFAGPIEPSTISGTSTICNGTTNTYSVTAVPGATSYTWTLPGGWSGTSTTNSIDATASATSGDITVTANNACGSSSAQTLSITVNDVPTTPGTISGTSTICNGTTNTYSVTAVSGATSYTWTLPGGWSGTSTTNSIDANASAASGDITVTANNACGSSSAQTLSVTVNDIPATPGTISGTSTICNGTTNNYSITSVVGATSYTWTLPSGWSGTSTTNSIDATASATSGDITVTANNACGSSSAQILSITVNDIPATPGTISGTSTICNGTTSTYSITAVAGATSYTWTLPSGWSGSSTTNSIDATASATSGDITVTVNNACGSSTAQTLSITVNDVPATPGTISGATTICNGTTNTYAVTAVAGATSYTWTLPGGWSGTSTTNSIDATASATSGDITVTANNACGSSSAQTLSITVNDVPSQPSSISGNTTICEASAEIYSVTNDVSAINYTWTLPGTWSGTSTTNSINATIGTNSGIISVTANNSCGSSAAQTLSVTVNPLPTVTLSLERDFVCEKGEIFALTGGLPAGGTYSGTGVSAGNFDAETAGIGVHTITYTYTDANNCTNSATDEITVDDCLGLAPNESENNIIIYPNPFSETITITSNIKLSENTHLILMNVVGEVVYQAPLTSTTTQINLSELSDGIYFLVVKSEGDSFVSRVVKN